MLSGNERMIVVLGMAHSGTTILTYVLSQHPDVVLATNGSEAWVLENTWLPNEETSAIQGVLNAIPRKRLLLKRPWNCVYHGEWMAREMPNARFLYCWRDFAAISRSWSKPTSLVESAIRNAGPAGQRDFYQFCWERAEAFGRTVPFFKKIDHSECVKLPAEGIADIAGWLELAPFTFDVSQVGFDKDIKSLLRGD